MKFMQERKVKRGRKERLSSISIFKEKCNIKACYNEVSKKGICDACKEERDFEFKSNRYQCLIGASRIKLSCAKWENWSRAI